MAETEEVNAEVEVTEKKKKKRLGVWAIVGIIVGVLVVVGGAGGGYLIHLSDTSPEFCATCHIMDYNVTSYLTSNDLDNVHFQAGVQCKECHDYPVPAEIRSGVKFVLGDYTVDAEGKLMPVSYGNDMCFQCHISYEHVGDSTDYLTHNPHNSHNGELPCKTCHVSHGDQVDYCGQCHTNTNQRILGKEYEPRGTVD